MESRIVRIGLEVLGFVVVVDELIVEGERGRKGGGSGVMLNTGVCHSHVMNRRRGGFFRLFNRYSSIRKENTTHTKTME